MSTHNKNRREFLRNMAIAGAALSLPIGCGGDRPENSQGKTPRTSKPKKLYDISLAEWSLHKMLFRKKLKNIDFPEYTKKTFGITAVEYVNAFFRKEVKDQNYLKELKKRTDDNGIKNLLIMCDIKPILGTPVKIDQKKFVDLHDEWLNAAKFLGCHSIRVNAKSKANQNGKTYTKQDQLNMCAEGLVMLGERAKKLDLNVIVENHGGLSGDGAWLAGIMKKVNMSNVGTLPDFGNFSKGYDRYKGTKELMPYAKGVSAKSHNFDAEGNETRSDYRKLMQIVLDAGYNGYVGIEYEGRKLSEVDGIKATQKLLETIHAEMLAKAQ